MIHKTLATHPTLNLHLPLWSPSILDFKHRGTEDTRCKMCSLCLCASAFKHLEIHKTEADHDNTRKLKVEYV